MYTIAGLDIVELTIEGIIAAMIVKLVYEFPIKNALIYGATLAGSIAGAQLIVKQLHPYLPDFFVNLQQSIGDDVFSLLTFVVVEGLLEGKLTNLNSLLRSVIIGGVSIILGKYITSSIIFGKLSVGPVNAASYQQSKVSKGPSMPRAVTPADIPSSPWV